MPTAMIPSTVIWSGMFRKLRNDRNESVAMERDGARGTWPMSGPVGHGLPVAVGMAKAAKLSNAEQYAQAMAELEEAAK